MRKKLMYSVVALLMIGAVGFAFAWSNIIASLTFHGSITASGNIQVDNFGTNTTTTGFTYASFDAIGNKTYSFTVVNTGNCPENITLVSSCDNFPTFDFKLTLYGNASFIPPTFTTRLALGASASFTAYLYCNNIADASQTCTPQLTITASA